jgi:hypothetical protein
VVRGVLRARWAVVVLLALGMAVVDLGQEPVDLGVFVRAGRDLLSRRWADTFADPDVQAGPVFLALYGALGLLADWLGVHVRTLVAPVVEVGVALAAMWTVRRTRRALGCPDSPVAELATGTLSVLWSLTSGAYVDGHPAQAAIPLLWLAAAVDQRSGRWLRAGVLLGLSAGWESWGLLGLPLLLLAPRLLDAARAVLLAIAAAALLFLPFALFGTVRTGDYRWAVTARAPLARWLAVGAEVGWSWRLAQGLAALAVGAAVAWALRHPESLWQRGSLWAVPVAVLATRLLLDPVNYRYYWLAPQLVVLIALGSLTRSVTRAECLALAGCCLLYAGPLVGELSALVLALASVAALCVLARRRTPVTSATAC